MGKKLKYVLVGLGVFLINAGGVRAKEYSINETRIKAEVKTDGSMGVEEERLYSFDGSFTFVSSTPFVKTLVYV